ncbi:MAG TPA: DinB family protein [Steroidobacteraceae bacterium]|nr:DinB family protein [Steroidobacteraceae bacterium]
MTDGGDYLRRQFKTAWLLTDLHLTGLTTEECLWRPAAQGMHVQQTADGAWRADWPEHERYDLGPPSIAWVTWHMGMWWSMVLDHSFGEGKLTREAVAWPGSAAGVREWLGRLRNDWLGHLEQLGAGDLQSTRRTRWPFRDRPFGDVVAWVNVELTKNASEIGYARFLYAVRR